MRNFTYAVLATLVFAGGAFLFLAASQNMTADQAISSSTPDGAPPIVPLPNLFSSATNCFSQWTSYDEWIAHLQSKVRWWNPRRYLLHKRFPRSTWDAAKADLHCQSVTYLSDGIIVNGWLLTPKIRQPGGSPIIVFNRGGNGSFGAITFASVIYGLSPYARRGFIVVASQYRGATNGDPEVYGRDEFGGADVNDVLNLLSIIKNHPDADPEKVYMFGASRGAMMTFLALKAGAEVAGVAVMAGVADLSIDLESDPRMEKVYLKRIPNYESNKQSELEKRSVVKWIDDIPSDIPILILHGDSDDRVSVDQARLLHRALTERNIPNKLVVYARDNHHLARNRSSVIAEVVEWFGGD